MVKHLSFFNRLSIGNTLKCPYKKEIRVLSGAEFSKKIEKKYMHFKETHTQKKKRNLVAQTFKCIVRWKGE